MKFIFSRITFYSPNSVDILIFDETNSHIVKEVINKKYTFFIFNQRPVIYYLGIKILIKYIKNIKFFFFNNLESSSRRLFFSEFFRTMKLLYLKSYIELINPKAVITNIDNSPNFHWLSKNCKICPFIAFQNGMRLRFCKDEIKNYYLQHFFCWGEKEINLFKENNYKVDNYYPTGSLTAGLYFDFKKRDIVNFKHDLLVVSSWRGNIGWSQDVLDTMNSMKKMDILLAKYISVKKIKAAIMLRSEVNSDNFFMSGIGNEIDYFKNIYKDSVEIIENNFAQRLVYKNMQNVNVIISCLSSALLEAYGIGKKIMYFNFTGQAKYHCNLDSTIVSSVTNWKLFKDVVDNLLAISYQDYYKIHQKSMNKIMSYPKKNMLNVIQYKIEEIISRHK